jgi:hypothetical protein
MKMKSKNRDIRDLIEGYFAGRLTFEQTEELFVLLRDEPDMLNELTDNALPVLSPEKQVYPNKNSLKKSYSDLSEDQFEYLCVAEIEGDLNPEQSLELKEIVASDASKSTIYNTYRRLRMVPGTEKFNNKASLRKNTFDSRAGRISLIAMSTAASVAIIVTTINWFTQYTQNEIARQNSIVTITEPGQTVPEQPAVENTITNQTLTTSAPPRNTDAQRERPLSEAIITTIESETAGIIPENSTGSQKSETSGPKPLSGDVSVVKLSSPIQSEKLASVFTGADIPYHGPISLKEHLAINFREKILGEDIPDISPLKAHEIASAGITGINKLLGWEMDLDITEKETGEANSLAFTSRLIKFQTPIKKANPDE